MARRSPLKKAAKAMLPNRVLARLFSGGRHQTFGAIVRSPSKVTHAYRMADEQKLTAKQRTVAPSARGGVGVKKAAAKKPAKGRGDVYAAARQVPARNQATAKKNAAAAKKAGKTAAAGRVQVPKRNPDGTFNGSVSFPSFGPREQAAYERALRGHVDPGQQVRQPRRK
jgi:hypothetical protein